jgi:hypothetical protein
MFFINCILNHLFFSAALTLIVMISLAILRLMFVSIPLLTDSIMNVFLFYIMLLFMALTGKDEDVMMMMII